MMMWGGGSMFMGLLFLLIIGFAIYFIIQAETTKKSEDILKEVAPLELLKIRYAKGEIIKEEYDRIRKDLKG
ncbi:MAG: SHOCT domain-containing protein [Candidatus Atribacteria bacterium]|nr:SHOCT domain-containing protein [Candidatus Atribacteria bacterium]